MARSRRVQDEAITANRLNWRLYKPSQKGMYRLALIDLLNGDSSAFTDPTANILPKGFPVEFNFPMNPQNTSMEEPAAVKIQPTQNGQFVEHQGQIYKNITIKGTTGLRPNRAITPSNFDNGGIDSSEQTGFDDLVNLVNLIRAYWTLKRDPNWASRTVMLWQNGKTEELFIVEPIDLKTERDASNPLTTSYEIPLRTIERWAPGERRKRKKDIATNKDGYLEKVGNARKELSRTFAQATRALDSYVSKGARYVTVLSAVNDVLDFLTNVTKISNRIVEIPRARLTAITSDITQLREAMESAQIAYVNNGIADKASDAIHALIGVQRAINKVYAIDELFSTTQAPKKRRKSSAYISSGEIETSGDDDLDVKNAIVGSTISESTVYTNDDIRKLSKRLLGSASQWKSLVIMNNLKAPYISSNGNGVDVLRPGDTIKYPSFATKEATAVSNTGKKRTDVSDTERAFGRDLKLVETKSGTGISIFDLEISNKGDLSTVAGLDNMVQAVRIKFETEEGELQLHPEFGIKYPVGVKASGVSSFIEFQVRAKSTVLSDPRIQSVDRLDIDVEGNVLSISANFKLTDVPTLLALDFQVKR